MHDPLEETSDSLRQELLANLDGMAGCLDLLVSSGQLTGLQREHVASAVQYTANLRAILEGLAECVQISRGRFVSQPQKTDMSVLLHSLARLHAPPLAERGIEFAVEIDTGIPSTLMVDGTHLRLILSNLLAAALNLAGLAHIALEAKENRVHQSGITLSLCASCTPDSKSATPDATNQPYSDLDSGVHIASKIAKALGWHLAVRDEGNTMAFLLAIPDSVG